MKVLSLSYNFNKGYRSPEEWLHRTDFYAGVLQCLADYCTVIDLHFIGYHGIQVIGRVMHHFLKPSLLFRPLPLRYHRYVRNLRPDVVVVHGLIFPWQIILLRLQLGKNTRILVQHHKEGPGRFPRIFLQRFADRYVDAYLFTCTELAEPWLKKEIIAHPGKIKQLFEGSSAFRPANRNEARKRTGVIPGLIYLWVGRLNATKDPLTVISAFLRFLQHRRDAALYMIFHTTELLDEVKMLLHANTEAARQVHLVGKVDHHELIHWYNSADFFILGSNDEATTISVCEAMSCGCVPILTDIPAFRAMTGYGKCGLLFPPGDEERLLKALVESARLDLVSEKQKVLGQFDSELSFDAIARSLFRILS